MRDRACAQIKIAHEGVRSKSGADVTYDANDPELGAWVFASAIDSIIEIDRRWLGTLSDADRGTFYAEMLPVAQALGVVDHIPDTYTDFASWVTSRTLACVPGEATPRLAYQVLLLGGTVPAPVAAAMRAATITSLHSHTVSACGLPHLAGETRYRLAQRAARTVVAGIPAQHLQTPDALKRRLGLK